MKERVLPLSIKNNIIECRVEYFENEYGIIVENVYGYINNIEYNLNATLLFHVQDLLNEEWEISRSPKL
tara:strand:+ start:616 stop:822 length:207 start_codon:yes stop_codon:yes gene_type:complete